MADVSLSHDSDTFIQKPAARATELSPLQRDIVCKALRVHASRIYLRLQFETALLHAELALLNLCGLCLQFAAAAESLVKKRLSRPNK